MEIDKTKITIETYNHIVEEWSQHYYLKDLKLQREMEDLVTQLPEGALILDAGTGIGDYPKFLTEQCDKDFQVTGIDASENMLKKAKKNAPKAEFELMDMRNITWDNGFFDAILCFAALIHVKDEECIKVLDKFGSLLKKDGLLAINVMEATNDEKEVFIPEPFNPKYKTYFNRYTKQFFLDYFKKNHYIVEKIYDHITQDKEAVGENLTGTNEFTIIVKKVK